MLRENEWDKKGEHSRYDTCNGKFMQSFFVFSANIQNHSDDGSRTGNCYKTNHFHILPHTRHGKY